MKSKNYQIKKITIPWQSKNKIKNKKNLKNQTKINNHQ